MIADVHLRHHVANHFDIRGGEDEINDRCAEISVFGLLQHIRYMINELASIGHVKNMMTEAKKRGLPLTPNPARKLSASIRRSRCLVDYSSKAITENTRASYPIEYIPNAKIPCVGPEPRNIIFLTCDAPSRKEQGSQVTAKTQ